MWSLHCELELVIAFFDSLWEDDLCGEGFPANIFIGGAIIVLEYGFENLKVGIVIFDQVFSFKMLVTINTMDFDWIAEQFVQVKGLPMLWFWREWYH